MTQKVQTFYEQAMQQLTPHERAELADLLADQEELDLYWRGELQRRTAEIDAGRATFVSEEELDRRLQRTLDEH